ncbi:MAG: hypothetical protein ABI538_04595 [Pseudoxanthomonas sp.]
METLRSQFSIRHFRHHLERLRRAPGRVEDCLAYPSMFDVPEAFEVWSVADFKRRRACNAALMWVDACPAYALAVATHAMYGHAVMLESDDELDAQWDELRGHSNLDWQRAREIVLGAWSALDNLALASPPPPASPREPAHKVGIG